MAKKNKPAPKVAAAAESRQSVPQSVAALPDFLTNHRMHCWLIAILSFVLYANTLFHDYALDDAIVITDNMFTKQGVKGIPGILQYDTFYGFFKEGGKANLVAGGRYRPFTLLMFAVEYQIFGATPFIGHFVNILLYALTGIVLYLLLIALFKPRYGDAFAGMVGLVSALLFIAHPVHTEAVANIKGRDEIVALLGSLGAAYYIIRYYYEKQRAYPWIAAGLFFMALLSKENAITFLAIVPLAFWFFTPANPGTIARQTLPLLGAALLFLLIRAAVIGGQTGTPPPELMNNPFLKPVNGAYVMVPFSEKMATILYTLGKYLQLLVYPNPLTHDYYPRHIQLMNWSDWQVILSALLYLGLILFAVQGFFRKSIFSFAILYYLITLSIVSNIVFPIGTNMSERFIFMPSIGFCILLGVLAYQWVSRKKRSVMASYYPAFSAVGLVIVLFGAKTIGRNPAWKDNLTLFSTDIKTSANSAKLCNAMGGEYDRVYASEQNIAVKTAKLNEAIGYLDRAVSIHPFYKNAYLLRGNCYFHLGNLEKAIESYQQSMKLDPAYKDAVSNLAVAYRDLGRQYGEQRNDLAKAIQYLEESKKLRPDDPEMIRLLGVAYGLRGEHGRAIENFSKLTEIQPQNGRAWYDLGTAYLASGNPQKGEEYRRKGQQLDPTAGK